MLLDVLERIPLLGQLGNARTAGRHSTDRTGHVCKSHAAAVRAILRQSDLLPHTGIESADVSG